MASLPSCPRCRARRRSRTFICCVCLVLRCWFGLSSVACLRCVARSTFSNLFYVNVFFLPRTHGHRPSFRGHSTYRRGLPCRRGTDAPHRLWIGVLRGREVSGSTRGAGTAVTADEVPQHKAVSGRHSDMWKCPARSGYSVANPKVLQYCPAPPVRIPAK